MTKRKVFVSFDYDNDKHYKYLLEAWNANPDFDFTFDDKTPNEINTYNIDRIKAELTKKINEATHTLFLVGKYANQLHKDYRLIGFTNWINFEAYQSIQSGNYLAVVKLENGNTVPRELDGKKYWYTTGFLEGNVMDVLSKAST